MELGTTINPAGPGHRPWMLAVWVCLCIGIGLSLWAVRSKQLRRIEAMEDHQHIQDMATYEALEELHREGLDGITVGLTALCEDCGEPLFLPRQPKRKG